MSDYLALPDEVVAEMILWRLPVKSILQCRCVCKSWKSLISSPNFISKHLRKTLTSPNPQIVMYQMNRNRFRSCLFFFDNPDCVQSLSVQVPHDLPHPAIKSVGSANGLICVSIGDRGVTFVVSFMIFNPLIGRFLSIPAPRSNIYSWNVRGFAYDEKTQDYKLLLIFCNWDAFIYSLNSNRWDRITCPQPKNWNMHCDSVVVVNGKFHWLACDFLIRYKFIMVLDTGGEAFGRISLPECVANAVLISPIAEFGESSIAVAVQSGSSEGYVTHVWIMKEYGVEESWIKLTLGNSEISVLGFRNKDEVLIRCESGCIASQKISNKLELEEVENIMDADPHPKFKYKVHNYVPSLVLLDKQNDVAVAAPTHAKLTKTAPTDTKQIKKTRAKRIKTTVCGTSVAAGITSAEVEGHRLRRAPFWLHDFITG